MNGGINDPLLMMDPTYHHKMEGAITNDIPTEAIHHLSSLPSSFIATTPIASMVSKRLIDRRHSADLLAQ
jgi:hypothetical protein